MLFHTLTGYNLNMFEGYPGIRIISAEDMRAKRFRQLLKKHSGKAYTECMPSVIREMLLPGNCLRKPGSKEKHIFVRIYGSIKILTECLSGKTLMYMPFSKAIYMPAPDMSSCQHISFIAF